MNLRFQVSRHAERQRIHGQRQHARGIYMVKQGFHVGVQSASSYKVGPSKFTSKPRLVEFCLKPLFRPSLPVELSVQTLS